MAFIRKIKKGDSIYFVKVERYREDGNVKQCVIENIGNEVNEEAVQKNGYLCIAGGKRKTICRCIGALSIGAFFETRFAPGQAPQRYP